jgi:hypothetical protein
MPTAAGLATVELAAAAALTLTPAAAALFFPLGFDGFYGL